TNVSPTCADVRYWSLADIGIVPSIALDLSPTRWEPAHIELSLGKFFAVRPTASVKNDNWRLRKCWKGRSDTVVLPYLPPVRCGLLRCRSGASASSKAEYHSHSVRRFRLR